MELADKIAVLSAGKVAQLGSVHDVYNSPASRYVAEFIGSANVLEGTLVPGPDQTIVRTAIGDVVVPDASGPDSGDVVVVTRAHRWWISTEARNSKINIWRGEVETLAYAGSHAQLVVNVDSQLVKVWVDPEKIAVSAGSQVWVGVEPGDCRVMDDQ